MGKGTVRLKDIADRTGFSTNTVSLALRDSPRIPAETRELIRQAAASLNYLPNFIAKSLVSRETKTIGLVLTDITNPTLTHTAQAIELALAERGYATLFATSNNKLSEEKKVLELVRSRQVDGILIYPTSHRQIDHIRALRLANYPVVMLVGDPDSGLDAVCVDESRGAYKATKHLIDIGHKRIGLIDGANPLGNREKRQGYVEALNEAGLEFDPALAVDPRGHSVIRGYLAMEALMATPAQPTAVFSANDSLALGALRWCIKHKLTVPDDMAIIGFDNIEFAEHAVVPLSSVNYPVDIVTELAVERLMSLITAGDELPTPRVTQIDPEVIVRDSTLTKG
ncbi:MULTISPECIES: LacI family DNA-binding transcriptional regulator [Devosia]|jgi:LacI family transcriptional regulator|uniref:LacI family DNA-binding transcriptional regulator n=1 Tax=Devosia litorisediminis TaxID=2829817 RepID=A0A942EHP5_9HYPH|nr:MULTISPECIES: LacI family DNA-binding transcriptional regulator [Devosia]MBS3850201.1 LacI family DNA-binding transcriptional regulator [Devosia litorisediminis]MCZ4347692.1 LacI family DNA-binding transcriptional regulator [Devosia neptuniae]|tara:strand:+ start:73338 stop:74357 length:1020 start_codon:yes stop_codon:yes gene_type:complete